MSFKQLALFFAVLCTGFICYSQEKLFDCEIAQRRSYAFHHIEDRTLNRSYMLLVSYDQVEVVMLDSAMKKLGQRSYKIGLKEEKHYLTEPLGFTAENGLIYGFYSNHDLTILGFLEFNLRSRRGTRKGQLPLDFNKRDEYLFHYVKKGTFYVASATKKSSVMKVYTVFSPKNIRRSLFRVDVYRDLHEMFKTFSEPKKMDIGVVLEEADLNTNSRKIKAYPDEESLRITFETVNGTEIIDLNLSDETYTDDIIHYRKFQKKGKTNNSNSFLIKDLHFMARSSGEEIFVYAERKGISKPLFSGRFTREDKDIDFANLVDGSKIRTSSRFYRTNPKDFIRSINDGNIGIGVEKLDTAYLVTVGNFKEDTNPLTNPYGSNISGRNTGESSFFQVLLSENFDFIPAEISTESDEKLISLFEENDIKAKYVYNFEAGNSNYVFFQDKKEKVFSLYKMD